MMGLIPMPAEISLDEGVFALTSRSRIVVTAGCQNVRTAADYLAAILRNGTGYQLPVVVGDSAAPSWGEGDIVLESLPKGTEPGEEGYAIEVTAARVTLNAGTGAGFFRGIQTVRQLFPAEVEGKAVTFRESWSVKCVRIMDRPRFRWRGLMLDTCRHFMTKEFLKKQMDLMAYYKINVFHWHLTEDQGWRLGIKKYPRLAKISAWRGKGAERHGGFYTPEDVRQIVEYAAARHIMVVPEIEMPGHCLAALAAYPELSCDGGPFEVTTEWGIFNDVYCAGNEAVFSFLEDVLNEVVTLFPSPYVHIGGDEVPKDRWKDCPKCQARMKAEGLADENALQAYFIARIARFLKGKGKRAICWDEVLEGGAPEGVVVQAWRDLEHGGTAAKAGHDAVISPFSHVYLDYDVKEFGLPRIYSLEPVPDGLDASRVSRILGGEACMWTERAPQETVESRVYPRLLGLAEVLWSPRSPRNYKEFSVRVDDHVRRLNGMGVQPGPAGGG